MNGHVMLACHTLVVKRSSKRAPSTTNDQYFLFTFFSAILSSFLSCANDFIRPTDRKPGVRSETKSGKRENHRSTIECIFHSIISDSVHNDLKIRKEKATKNAENIRSFCYSFVVFFRNYFRHFPFLRFKIKIKHADKVLTICFRCVNDESFENFSHVSSRSSEKICRKTVAFGRLCFFFSSII